MLGFHLALAAICALVLGGAANWMADELPLRSKHATSGRPLTRGVAGGMRGSSILHYLTLPWYFFTKGRCPHCGERRPLRAPLLELAMIAAFVFIAWRFAAASPGWGGIARIVLYWLYAWFLLTVLVIDLEHRLVLNVMTLPAAILALAGSLLPGAPTPVEALVGGALGFGVFFLIALIGRGAMGHRRRQAGRRDRPDGGLPAGRARAARWASSWAASPRPSCSSRRRAPARPRSPTRPISAPAPWQFSC